MTPDATTFLDDAAEQAALGVALTNDGACRIVCAELQVEHLYRERERDVLRAIRRLHGEGRPVDAVTVAAQFDDEARDYVHALAERPAVAAHVRDYVRIITDNAARRALLTTLQQAQHVLVSGNGNGPAEARNLVTAALEAMPAAQDRGTAFVDWTTFWDHECQDDEWEYPDVLARGRGHVIYAGNKTGKSLLMLYIAAHIATHETDVDVTYLDYEMTPADVRERLEDMGYGPESDLSRLHYALLPDLPPLDTPEGGQALCAVLDGIAREHPDRRQVLAMDTFGRAVFGPEDAADTIRAFYACTGIHLKRRGTTWVRVDHSGYDADHPRGSSAKRDDVDVVWRLKQTENGVELRRDRARMSWVPERVRFLMKDGPLRYLRAQDDYPAGTGEVANILDRLDVPLHATSRQAQAALRSIQEGRRRDTVTAALRYRRDRLNTL